MDLEILAVVGRLIVGLAFILTAIRLFLARVPVAGLLGQKGVPYPSLVPTVGAAIEIGLGVLALVGWAPPVVFLAMAAFVVAATAMVHDFWRQTGPQRAQEVNTVLAHSLIVGGLFVMAAYPW